MPTILESGDATYLIYTQTELGNLGLVQNHHTYLGDYFRFCVNCNEYNHVIAMSRINPRDTETYEVCDKCKTHARRESKGEIKDVAFIQYLSNRLMDPRD